MEDTTEERLEGEMEHRFHLKVTSKGVGGTRLAKCNVNEEIVRNMYQNV